MRSKSYFLANYIVVFTLALILLANIVLADTQMTGRFQGLTATITNPAGGQGGTWVIACVYTMAKPLNVAMDQNLVFSERIYVEDGQTLYKDYSGLDNQYECRLQFDIAEEDSCPQPPYFNGANLFAFTFSGGPFCPSNPVCGNNIWEVGEQCEHEDECNDGNANTIDSCDSCACYHTPVNNPVCGDGTVTAPEQCETNAHCNDNNAATTDVCSNCMCSNTPNNVCGNGIVTAPETCELPNTNNNAFCSQTTQSCSANRTGVRDGFGNCNGVCGCTQDPFQFSCVAGSCGATCDDNLDCNDNNAATTDVCNSNCGCTYTSSSCGNGVVNAPETCELPNTNNNAFCTQTTQSCSGNRTGVRDGFGNCDAACGCAQDIFQFSCVAGSCGAVCANNIDCNDNNPATTDTCNANCGCTYTTLPTCGDGIVTAPEQCETNAQCPSGQTCNSCVCSGSPVCGNAILNTGEQCDFGAAINGIPCVPPNGGTCNYCTSNCTFANVTGNVCGNSIVDYGEQCDEGIRNGVLCTAVCDDFCTYCRPNCQVGFIDGPTCYTNETPPNYPPPPPEYPCGGYNCPIPLPPRGPTPRASICGDGIVGLGEECDFGYENGIACSPSCNGECGYCDANCHAIVLDGAPCVRKARPWDATAVSECRWINILPTKANLDNSCSGNNLDVTRQVNVSDNDDARQQVCTSNPTYIYLSWLDLQYATQIRNVSIFLEHEEENARTELEYYNGTHWERICTILRADVDNLDSCEFKRIVEFENISVRIKIIRQGANAVEKLDHAYLGLEYCGESICGNRNLNPGELCDDAIISESDLLCGDYSACVDGKQTQICYFGNYIKTNVKKCGSTVFVESFLVIILIFLLILLILFFLFFPAIYFALTKKKKKK